MGTHKKIHILLVDNSNAYGGLPAMTAWLANGMTQRGHQVTLYNQRPFHPCLKPLHRLWRAVVKASTAPERMPAVPRGTRSLWELYPLHPSVRRVYYDFTDNNLQIQALRSRLKELSPDVCLPIFGDSRQLVWAVTLLGSGIPYCYTEVCSPSLMHTIFWSRKGRLAAMSGADRIHLLHKHHKNGLPEFLQDRVRCIPNPLPAVSGRANVKGTKGKPLKLLWVARFESYKQWKLMIEAFNIIASRFPDWELHMVGHGEELPLARKFVRDLPCADRVIFHHNVPETAPYYRDAQLFCISSYAEGQPVSLLEAQAWGLPSIGFEDCDGVSCQIREGKTGTLAWPMSATGLAEALELLMGDASLRQDMQDELLAVSSSWAEKDALDAWEQILLETAACKGNTVMDAFQEEPFASEARLSSVARREWLRRDFGNPFPGSPRFMLGILRGTTIRVWRRIFS